MADPTEAQLKAAARKALAAGDTAAAKRLVEAARKVASAPVAKPATEAAQFTPDGRPMNDAAKAELILKAKLGETRLSPEVAGKQAMTDSLAENDMRQGAFGAFAGNLAQGMTFGFADEIAAGGDERTLAALRAKRGMDETQHPIATTGGDVSGAIMGSVPLTMAAAPAVPAIAPASLAGRIVGGGVVGSAVGAAEGGLAGAGYANGENIKDAAIQGARIGGLFGGIFGAAAPAAASGIKSLAGMWKGRDTKTISRVLGVDKATAEVIKRGMSADDPVKALAKINAAGPDAMLADSGKGMAGLLDASMQFSPGAARVAGGRIEERAARAGKRLVAVFDDLLGAADDGIKTAAKGVASRTAKIREAAYERAFSKPIDYASDAGKAIDDVVARVPKDRLSAAIKTANDAMQIEGRTAKQIMATIADDGTVKFSKPLDIFQLNELKKALGETARGAVDQFGRLTGEGRRIKSLEVDLAKALGEAVPEYRTAVKLGGDKIAEDQALALGRKMLSPQVTREEVIETLGTASRDAKAAAKKGLRIAIDEKMANIRAVVSDGNVDAREAMAMIKDLSSKAARQKAVALMGSKSADRLFDALDEATAHLELRAAVARNSATAGRLAIKQGVEDVVGDSVLDAARDGEPINFIKRGVQALTGGSKARKDAELQRIYAVIGDALTGPQGADAKRAMAAISKALEGQPIKDADAELIARLLSSGGALVGYQTETRPRITSQGAQ